MLLSTYIYSSTLECSICKQTLFFELSFFFEFLCRWWIFFPQETKTEKRTHKHYLKSFVNLSDEFDTNQRFQKEYFFIIHFSFYLYVRHNWDGEKIALWIIFFCVELQSWEITAA